MSHEGDLITIYTYTDHHRTQREYTGEADVGNVYNNYGRIKTGSPEEDNLIKERMIGWRIK